MDPRQKPALTENDSVKKATQARADFPDIPAAGNATYKVSTSAVTFSAEYVYRAGNTDNEETSGIITLEHVKRLLLNKIGEFFQDKTEAGNSGLTREQLASFAAGALEMKVIRRAQDGRSYYIKAEAGGAPVDILKYINDIRYNDIKGIDLLETRKIAENALNEIDKLRRESFSDHEVDLEKQERFAKAVTELKMINAFERGRVWQHFGVKDAAIKAYSSAIEINPQFVYAYFNRGVTYCSYFFDTPGAFSYCMDSVKSLEDLSKAIELSPHNAYFFYRRGYGCKDNNVVQAIEDFNKAIELNPQDARAFYERGAVYLKLSDYSKAIKDFDKAIELNPRSMMTYNSQGLAYYKLAAYRRAINSFDKAIELSPQNDRLYYNRGTAYDELGEYQQAINDFGKAIELNPRSVETYYKQGLVYNKLAFYRQAINSFDKAIELSPQNAIFYYNRGTAYDELGEYQQAFNDFDRVSKLDPSFTDADLLRSRAYDKLGDKK